MTSKCLSLAIAGSLIAGNAWAGACVRPLDEMAMRTAALQQQLMVAALSCSEIARYNRFVVSHQSELQQSDKALLAFFKRENGAGGTAAYHAFKTRAANTSALQSAQNGDAYCANARQAYDAAFSQNTTDLATFVRSQWSSTDQYISVSCTDGSRGMRTAGGAAQYATPAPHAPIASVAENSGGN
jgi:hypothetical protein